MRWDALFEDLAAQLVAAERAEHADAVADLTRAEQATTTLVERFRGTATTVTVELHDGTRVHGSPRDAARDWLLLEDGHRQHLVPTTAVAAVAGLGRFAHPAPSATTGRLGLGHVLRGLMRDRRPVQVRTSTGAYSGWVGRVGKDHVDLEVSPGAVHGARTVPHAALLCVSDTGTGAIVR
ncbi:hypothetical protein [Cellulosimicrobium marinum]|uniref:hypothetical protein n=1 Tax=Cellulosimicrobium marinum TaxID=1638992 RepID=UPI001E2B7F1F|nr:hypothetical protein [Cellulosimicrobium marinum]MCB7137235.1 hypothetical protein [Cellulosimicrobium marinum]